MKGGCLCGAVRVEARGEPRHASVCHCGQCRRMSGGTWASASFASPDLTVTGPLRWFRASPGVRRGFCAACGAFLIWEREGSGEVAVALGAMEAPTGLRDLPDIFVPDPASGGRLDSACLCGAVTVAFEGNPGALTACHCTQCRRQSGHVPVSFDDPGRSARIEGPLLRYVSAQGGVRSFCPTCGTKIAFEGRSGLRSLEAGLFDALAGRAPDLHIFVAEAGDYYDLPPGRPAFPGAGPD